MRKTTKILQRKLLGSLIFLAIFAFSANFVRADGDPPPDLPPLCGHSTNGNTGLPPCEPCPEGEICPEGSNNAASEGANDDWLDTLLSSLGI
jgi:hypothetical protein